MATIGEVAALAQVSRSTVSYVLSGRKYVTPETKKKVREAIKELDFTVSAKARALATSRTMILGIVLSFTASKSALSLSTYAIEISEQARLAGYRPLLLTGDALDNIQEVTASGQVDGLILFDVVDSDPRIEAALLSGVPTVLIGMPCGAPKVDSVDLDYSAAGALAVDDILSTGARKLALLGQPPVLYETGLTYAHRFRRGVRERANAAGVELCYFEPDNDQEELRVTLAKILNDSSIGGLIIHNDAALRLLSEMLLRISRPDMELVTLGPRALSVEAWFPYAAIDNEARESSHIAMEMLLRRLEGSKKKPESVLIPPRITRMPGIEGDL